MGLAVDHDPVAATPHFVFGAQPVKALRRNHRQIVKRTFQKARYDRSALHEQGYARCDAFTSSASHQATYVVIIIDQPARALPSPLEPFPKERRYIVILSEQLSGFPDY